jgi:preprotein translocase subunit SecG
VHVLTALSIIGLILLQQGKGAEAGASFGAGASQTVFGSQGSGNFFSRLTAIMATIFFVTSFGLAILSRQSADANVDADLPAIPAAVEERSPVLDSDIPQLDEVPPTDLPSAETPAASDELPAASDEEEPQ